MSSPVHPPGLSASSRLHPARVPLTLAPMFFFFSNKFGCLGSVLISLALSALLYLLFRVL